MESSCWHCNLNDTEPATLANPIDIRPLMAEVDQEIRDAEETLRLLLDKRRNLFSDRNHRLDPILRFPPEIASYIFECCLPSRDKRGDVLEETHRDTRMPWLLRSVCRGWHNIFSSTPQLWSTITLKLPDVDSLGVLARFTQEWVDRSCSLPVTIRIECRQTYPAPQSIDSWIPFFDAINHCSTRWKCLSLNIPDILLPFLQGDGQAPAMLKELRFYDKHYGERRYGFFLRNAIPCPEKVNIDALPLSLIGISWSHLKHVTIRRIGLNECLSLFQLAPDMTYCHMFSISGFNPLNTDVPSPSEHIIHRSLKTLILGNDDHMLQALHRLTLPGLEVLKVDTFSILDPENLPAFVKRSSCPLTKLTITGSSGGLETLSQLTSVPTVTDLTIFALHLDINFVKALTLRPVTVSDADKLLPNLRRLALHIFDAQLPWSFIPDLFRPQSEDQSEDQDRRVKALIVDLSCARDGQAQFRSSMNPDLAHRLQALREDGFDIKVPFSLTGASLDLLDQYLEEGKQHESTRDN